MGIYNNKPLLWRQPIHKSVDSFSWIYAEESLRTNFNPISVTTFKLISEHNLYLHAIFSKFDLTPK